MSPSHSMRGRGVPMQGLKPVTACTNIVLAHLGVDYRGDELSERLGWSPNLLH